MFTCPEDDVHSIYLDNELPQKFIAEYEAHIASCPKCKARLEMLKTIHDELKADADSIKVDQAFLDQSFERLQNRMRYSKSVSYSKPKTSAILFPELKKYIPAAVAAIAVFAVMLPFSISARRNTVSGYAAMSPSQVQTFKRNVNFTLNNNSVVQKNNQDIYPITFNLNDYNLTDNLNVSEADGTIPAIQMGSITSTFQKHDAAQVNDSAVLLSDDFFMPAFAQSEKPVLMRVYVPAYVEIPPLNK